MKKRRWTYIIPPLIPIKHIKPRRELVPIRILAERAQPIRICDHVPASQARERARVRFTRAPGRRGEPRELALAADHGDGVGDDAAEALAEVVEGGEPVHPAAPEGGDVSVRHDDAAEGDDEGEEGRDEEGSQQLVGAERRDHLPERRVEDCEDHHHHPHVPCCERVAWEPRPEVPAAEVDGARDGGVREFREDGACDAGEPGVNFGLGFAGFEEVAEMEEAGLELLDQGRSDD